jgi:hypothetical protein
MAHDFVLTIHHDRVVRYPIQQYLRLEWPSRIGGVIAAGSSQDFEVPDGLVLHPEPDAVPAQATITNIGRKVVIINGQKLPPDHRSSYRATPFEPIRIKPDHGD